jgi:DNA-binding transcriptional regulator YhcF (GntR family)
MQLKNECEEILSLDNIMKVEETKEIIINCADLDIEVDEMLEILECVYRNL